jgi:plastocyanin
LTPARTRRGSSLAAALLAAGPFLALAAPLPAATIRGHVDVRLEWPKPEPRPAVGALGMSGPRETPDRSRSVVYLEVGPLAAFEDGDVAPAELDQRNEAFLPYVLAVRAGATVRFPNHDRTYHNVFSFSKPKRFDLGRYANGQSKALRFDKPGVVRVFCDIHAHMSAFILVFAHPFFAVTDAEGRYRIADVPSGSHSLTVWTDGEARETRKVEVPPGEASLDQDFVVK